MIFKLQLVQSLTSVVLTYVRKRRPTDYRVTKQVLDRPLKTNIFTEVTIVSAKTSYLIEVLDSGLHKDPQCVCGAFSVHIKLACSPCSTFLKLCGRICK